MLFDGLSMFIYEFKRCLFYAKSLYMIEIDKHASNKEIALMVKRLLLDQGETVASVERLLGLPRMAIAQPLRRGTLRVDTLVKLAIFFDVSLIIQGSKRKDSPMYKANVSGC